MGHALFRLIQQFPDNFSPVKNIKNLPALISGNRGRTSPQARAVVDAAAKISIPHDTAALISLKRMAVGIYLQTLASFRRVSYVPFYLTDLAALEHEYQTAHDVATELLQHVGLGGTPIDVNAMVEEPRRCYCDYTERPWENDAFFCGDMATAYWQQGMGLLLKTYPADQCSRAYELGYSGRTRISDDGEE
jgi:hypothetical protein